MEPVSLEAHWMPFTGNRQFKGSPDSSSRLFVSAEGAYYTDANGKKVFDGLSGLWCCGLGHNRREIVEAVHEHHRALPVAKRGVKAALYRWGFQPAYNLLPEALALKWAYKLSVTAIKR